MAEQAAVAQFPNSHAARGTKLRAVVRFARNKPLGAICGLVVILLLLLALFGQFIAPYPYDGVNAIERLHSPSWSHPFGTDVQGRDVFSRVIYGARTSVLVGFSTVAIVTIVGTTLGMISAYIGGWFDLIFQRLMDIWQAFPGLIFLLFIVAVVGTGIVTLVVSLSLLMVSGTSRVIRSQTLSVTNLDYILAARAAGANDARIIARHILPNIASIILVDMSGMLAAVILIEASLSFLGLGVPIPFPSWGRMLQESQPQMERFPYLALFPGLAIAVSVFALNMFGDALRDVLDPRSRQR